MGIIIKRKKQIMMNEPRMITVSGDFVHFKTDITAPLVIVGTGNVTICGKNIFDEQYPDISTSVKYRPYFVGNNIVTMSSEYAPGSGEGTNLFILPGSVSSGASTANNGVWNKQSRTVTPINGYVTIAYRNLYSKDPSDYNTMIEVSNHKTEYEPFDATTSQTLVGRKPRRGANNVYSDNGSVTVTYWGH